VIARPSTRTILIGIGLFVFFLILRFPYRNVRGYVFGEIYKNTGIRVTADDLSPSFLGWPGVKLYKANITIPIGAGSELDLIVEQVTARVGIGSFFPPAPLLSVYAYRFQKGGNLYVKGSQTRNYISGSIQAEDLNLSQFLTAGLPEPIQGILRATGEFGYDQVDLAKSTGNFDLAVGKLEIPGMNMQGIILPAISWDEVKAVLAVRNGNLEITQGQFGTPKSAMRGTLNGYLRLGRDISSTYLNLVLKIQMTDEYKNDPQSATLVSFLKTFESSRSPGEYAMKWSATIRDMGNNIMLALPTKAE
jgi:type II secretion system protein N